MFSSCSLQNDDSVSVVHVGESTVEIETEANSNDITETAVPLHDKPSTGMFGFYDAIFSTHICSCVVCLEFALLSYCHIFIHKHGDYNCY